jgi:hypothetical protein
MGAQEPGPVYDRFAAIKDTRLHAALSTVVNIRGEISGLEGAQQVEIFNRPESLRAIGVVLAAVESSNLSDFPEVARYYLITAVEAAVISGSKEHVPALKKLAHDADKDIRDAVASSRCLQLSPSPSLEVLRESIRSAEARLPTTFPNSQEEMGPFSEFENRVGVFSAFAGAEQQSEIASIVERFLSRYDNARFKAFYGPRMQRLLQDASSRLRGLDAGKEPSSSQGMDPSKKPNTNPTSAPSEEPTSSTPWSTIVVLIVAAIGLLWLLLKGRK